MNSNISTEAKINLKSELLKVMDTKYAVISQQAGIRPVTKDSRPFIGFRPKIKTIGFFVGLCSKGVILAQWLVRDFCDT